MSNIHYYRIHSDGKCESVEETTREVLLNQDQLMSMAKNVVRKYPRMFDASLLGPEAVGNVGAAINSDGAVFTVPVGILPMTAVFRMEGDILTPTFASADSDTISLKWTPPADMKIYLMVTIYNDSVAVKHYAGDAFLFAEDSTRKRYRLPVSNVYEDGRLCTGTYDAYGTTCIEAMAKCWKQFQISRWQKDLVDRGGANHVKNSLNMFRYKPKDKSDGFDQLPIVGAWTNHCMKFGNEFITQHFCV